MKLTLLSLLVFVSLSAFPSICPAQQELKVILNQALEYRALQSFWCRNDSGSALLHGIDPNRRMSAQGAVWWFDRQLPLKPLSADSAYTIVLRRLSLNRSRSRATVRFTYHQRVRAQLRLHFDEGRWHVKKALIRQKEGCEPGSEGRRFVWDF